MEPWAFLFLRGLPGGHWCPCAPREAHVPKAQNTWLAKNAPDLCSQRPLQSAAPAAASPDAISQVSPTLPCGQVEATPLQGHRVYAPRAAPPQAAHTSHPVPETPLNWQANSWVQYLNQQVLCRRVLAESREFLNLCFAADPAMGSTAADRDPMGALHHLRDFLNRVTPAVAPEAPPPC